MKTLLTTIGLFVILACNAQLKPGQSTTITCQADSLVQVIYDLNSQKVALQQANQYQAVTISTLQKELEDCVTSVPPEPEVKILFESGFESPVSISQPRITGWQALLNLPGVSDFQFNISRAAYSLAEIRTDPVNANNRCLYGQVTGQDPLTGGTTRFQGSWRFDQPFAVYHFSYDVYFSPDIAKLQNYSGKIDWFTLIELWEKHRSNMDGDSQGQTRWNIGLFKDVGANNLYLNLHQEWMQPASKRFDFIWSENNKAYKLPFGRWVNLDFYFKRGQKDGRIIVKIDGQVIFDVTNYTEYPDSPLDIWAINPWKLYTSMTLINYINNVGGKLYAYYDNFKWYEK